MADVERWITVHPNGADSKGQPIPVKEGQNNKQATESFLAKKKNKAINPEEKAKEKFVQTMNAPVDSVVDVQSKYNIVENNKIRKLLEKYNVKPLKVNNLRRKYTDKEIINRVGMLDKTKGSCTTVAFAYMGNKMGLDVLDFRGKNCISVFRDKNTLEEIANLENVNSIIVNEVDDYNAALKLTNKMQEGKEYVLAIGEHCSIVRKNNGHLQYLELQEETKSNGFKKLNRKALMDRFEIAKYIKPTKSFLIECESLGKNKDFQTMLAYINNDKKRR